MRSIFLYALIAVVSSLFPLDAQHCNPLDQQVNKLGEQDGPFICRRYDPDTAQITAEFFVIDHCICARHFYFYDADGAFSYVVLDDGSTGDFQDLTDVSGQRVFFPSDFQTALSMPSAVCSIALFEGAGDFFQFIGDKIGEALNFLVASLHERLTHRPSHENVEWLAQQLFGEVFVRMSGYHNHPPEGGIYGKGEISNEVRITMINGILNLRDDAMNLAKLISDMHGGTNVHYVFRPTQGWAWDLLGSSGVKCGLISQQAKDLALEWKALIEEMGGVEGGGTIIHYAHSIGAADTYAAKYLLSPEELAMVSVVTFGCPIVFPNQGFKSVVNYASVRDFVPYLRLMGTLFEDEDNVVYIGSHFGIPLIDHLLNNESYRSVIEGLGQEFVNLYGDFAPTHDEGI